MSGTIYLIGLLPHSTETTIFSQPEQLEISPTNHIKARSMSATRSLPLSINQRPHSETVHPKKPQSYWMTGIGQYPRLYIWDAYRLLQVHQCLILWIYYFVSSFKSDILLTAWLKKYIFQQIYYFIINILKKNGTLNYIVSSIFFVEWKCLFSVSDNKIHFFISSFILFLILTLLLMFSILGC